MPSYLETVMRPEELQQLGVDSMTKKQYQVLKEWGQRMFTLGQQIVADIDEVKYDGRLVILSDGTRWEVDSYDASTVDMWGPMDKVLVIDDEMFKLDDMEKVTVQKDDV